MHALKSLYLLPYGRGIVDERLLLLVLQLKVLLLHYPLLWIHVTFNGLLLMSTGVLDGCQQQRGDGSPGDTKPKPDVRIITRSKQYARGYEDTSVHSHRQNSPFWKWHATLPVLPSASCHSYNIPGAFKKKFTCLVIITYKKLYNAFKTDSISTL